MATGAATGVPHIGVQEHDWTMRMYAGVRPRRVSRNKASAMFYIANKISNDLQKIRIWIDCVKMTWKNRRQLERFEDGSRMVLDFERCYAQVNLIQPRILHGELVS